MTKDLISIVIPCYNASAYIEETLRSILDQELVDLEIIVIDDGSTDTSKEKILCLQDKRITYKYQQNKGVSWARNEGLKLAKGNYIVFFDADDIMTKEFLAVRYHELVTKRDLDFVSGEVVRFKNNIDLKGYGKGAQNISEILLYHPEVDSCPSNYMFTAQFLFEKHLVFNDKLSSTADRYFLIECMRVGRTKCVRGKGALRYRVSDSSMSGTLNAGLVNDNEKYYELLLNKAMIPTEIKNKSLFLGSYILFASYWKIKMPLKAFKFGWRAFKIEPIMFIKKIL